MSIRPRALSIVLSTFLVLLSLLLARDLTAEHAPTGENAQAPTVKAEQPAAISGTRLTSVGGDIPTTVSTAGGFFNFTNLKRGTHQLYLDPATLPPDLRPAPDAPLVSLWINPGQTLVSDVIGAGVRFSATYTSDGTTISGIVFVDRNEDGQHDVADASLAGVIVVDPTIHQYFVPFDDDELWRLFAEINNDSPPINECFTWASRTSRNLNSFISVTSSGDGTVFYYDHWEDGYDADPFLAGPTTQVGVIDAGVTQTFNDVVATPRVSSTLQYDGRDRITLFGEPASVIRAAYPVTLEIPGPTIRLGDVLAGSWSVPEVSNWGQRYVGVVGEDLASLSLGVHNDFDYVGLEIMAAQADTQVFKNGVLLATIGTGETFLIDGANDGPGGGGVDSSDVITATGPIQVQMLGANCSFPDRQSGWSARGATFFPVDDWHNDYWAPVPDFTENPQWCQIDQDAEIDDRDTDIYIHNPHPYSITVTFDDGGPGTPIAFSVPARSTISALAILSSPPYNRDLNDSMGIHLYSTEVFWAVSAVDSISSDTVTNSLSNYNDWGYGLIPADLLSSEVIMGWSPGNSLKPPTINPIHNNGNLAFVTALTDTTVYVDFTQDGLPDAFDMNGDGDANDYNVHFNGNFDEPRSNDGVLLGRGEVLRVSDPNDNDLIGAVIYTRDLGHKIAVAWGQDPCRSTPVDPYMDLGYTVLPLPIPELTKRSESTPVIEADICGNVNSAQVLTYTITLHNNGIFPIAGGVLTDTLPYTYTDFVVNSLAASQPPTLGDEDYLNGNTGLWGYTPVSNPDGVDPDVYAFRLAWPSIDGGQTVTVTFNVRLQDDIPPDLEEITNQAIFGSDATGITISEDPEDPLDLDTDVPIVAPDLQITKIAEPATVTPGDLITYSVVATNIGRGPARSAIQVDRLPLGVTYQPGTLNLTLPEVVTQEVILTVPYTTTFDGSYADDFDLTITQTTGYSGSDGSLAWLTDWIEVNDDDDPSTGDIRVGSVAVDALSAPGYLELTDSNGTNSSVTRQMDLSDFVAPTLSFYVYGATNAGDDTLDVRVDGTSLAGFPEQYNGVYQQRVRDLSAYAGDATVTLEFEGRGTMDAGDVYRIDNIVIYEASPLRFDTKTIVETTSSVTYTTQTGIDPVGLDPATNTMTVTNPVDIPPGAQVRYDFQVRVDGPLDSATVLLNTAVITSTDVGTQPCLLAAEASTLVQSSHVLTITKSDEPDPVIPGQLLTYTLFWEVAGDEPAPGVVVTDSLPLPYVSFFSCAPLPQCQGETAPGSGTVVWELGDRLPPMSGITYDAGPLTLTVRVEQYPPGGVFTNTVIIDDETDVPPDEDDEPTEVLNASFELSKQRITGSPVDIGESVQFLIVITNTGVLTITDLPLEDTYDPVYLEYVDALPPPDSALPGVLRWNDLTAFLPGFNFALPPSQSTQVLVEFTAITSTQQLNPPVTINTAISEGAQTAAGELPREEDDADVGIIDEGGTAIELLYFRAGPKANGVLVEWATLIEVNTHGFWLYRSADAQLSHAVPAAFVPSKGWLGIGATYQYLDDNLPAGQYHYWLIEEENSGKRTTYGPVSALSDWNEADFPYRLYLPLLRWGFPAKGQ